MLPDLVYFTEAQHNLFQEGLLKAGDSFVIGITNCNRQVMTVKNIGVDGYTVTSNKGAAYHINFDIEQFNQDLFKKKQTRWCFYTLIQK